MPQDAEPQLPHEVALQAASNLRDLGGYRTASGRAVRRGLVYRAPALVRLTPQDEAAIAALGLRTTADLRGVAESGHNPVELPGAERVALPIEPTVGAELRDILRTGIAEGHVTPDDMMDLLRQAYEAYAVQSYGQYRQLFALLLDAARLPLLLHCSAGKDRTGFGSALILTALGVPHDMVVQDYLATNRVWKREIAGFFELPQAVRDTLLSAHEPLLAAAFAAAERQFGSIDVYLRDAIGLDDAAREALQHRLLEG